MFLISYQLYGGYGGYCGNKSFATKGLARQYLSLFQHEWKSWSGWSYVAGQFVMELNPEQL